MGFFLDDKAALTEKPPQQGRRTAARAAKADPNAVGCDVCPLKKHWADIDTPKMPISGNLKDPDVLIIGEAPGEWEDRKGVAFVGDSGKLLRETLPARAAQRCAFQNVVRCRPQNNRTPTAAEAHACSIHLRADIDHLPSVRAILGLGGVPLDNLVPELPPKSTITIVHGIKMPIAIGERVLWFFPTLHPSAVLRSQGKFGEGRLMPSFRSDLRHFFRDLDIFGKPTIRKFNPEDVIIVRTEEEAYGYIDKMRHPIAIDFETACDIKGVAPKPYMIGARLLIASMSDGETTIAFAVDHPEQHNDWAIDVILHVVFKSSWIAHNLVYELTWVI